MAAIPLPAPADVKRISVERGTPMSARSGEQYGGPAAEALGQVGAGLQQFGAAVTGLLAKQKAQRDDESVATALLGSSYQKRNNDLLINYPDKSGTGLVEAGQEDYMKFVEEKTKEYAATGASAAAQRQYRLALLEKGKGYIDSNAVAQSKMAEADADTQLDRGTATIINDIGAHGLIKTSDHEAAVAAGVDAINKRVGLTQHEKEVKILDLKNKAAIMHFSTIQKSAKTPADLQAAIADLHTKYWTDQLDTPDYMRIEGALAATASAMGQISARSAADPHVNAIRLDPTKYDAELAAGEKAIRETPGIEGADANKQVDDFRSDATRMYFEALAEAASTAGQEGLKSGKLKTSEEALKGIEEIKAELHKDPRWSATMTREQMDNLLGNLETRENGLNAVFNKVQSDLLAAHNAKVTDMRETLSSGMASIAERQTANQPVPQSEIQDALDLGAALIKEGGMTPALSRSYATIANKAKAQGIVANAKTVADLDAAAIAITNEGHHEFKVSPDGKTMVHTPTGKHSPGRTVSATGDTTGGYVNPAVGRHQPGGASVIKGDSDHVPVTANIRDATSLRGLQSQAYTAMEVASASAHSHGVVRLEVVAGRGAGHLSHAGGYDVDYIGFQADGSPWTPTQRAQVARDMMQKGGVDRIGLYEGGTHRNVLHAGISHAGFGPAMWGAGNLTGGAASRNYVDPESRKLLAEFSGGHATGGRFVVGTRGGGSFYDALSGFEARGQNVSNTDKKTSSGWARGYFQITDGTWSDNAGKGILAKYPTASDAPYDVQKQVADSLLMKRWAPETLDKMRAAGWTIDPDKTLAENAAANGGGPSGPGGGGITAGRADTLTVPPSSFTQAQHDQLQVVQTAREQMVKGLDTDLMTTGAKLLGVEVPQFGSPTYFKDAQQLYNKLVTTHNATTDQKKPFTVEQAAALATLFNSVGNNEQKAKMYAGIATWTPEMQKAAYKQVEQSAPFGAMVGGLYGDGKKDVALQAQHGEDLLKTASVNKFKIKWEEAMQTANTDVLGNVLRGTPDAGLTSIGIGKAELYKAIYAEKYGLDGDFNQAAYEQIVEQVEGGQFGTINGTRVLKPVGVEDGEWEAAQPLLMANPEVSTTHLTPMARDTRTGLPAPAIPSALANAHPIRTAIDTYQFLDDAGQWFVVQTPDGVQRYEAVLDAKTIKETAVRAFEQDRLENPYGRSGIPPFTGGPMIAPGIEQLMTPEPPAAPAAPAVDETIPPAAATPGGGNPTVPVTGAPPPPLPVKTRAVATPAAPAAPAAPVKPLPLSKEGQATLDDTVSRYEATLRRSGASDETVKRLSSEFSAMMRERLVRTAH